MTFPFFLHHSRGSLLLTHRCSPYGHPGGSWQHSSASCFGDTEGAQGVLNCPLGNTVLFEPVSVVTLLHPIIVLRYHTTLCQPVAAWSAAEVLGRSAATTVYRSEWRVRHCSYPIPNSHCVVVVSPCAASSLVPCCARPRSRPLDGCKGPVASSVGPPAHAFRVHMMLSAKHAAPYSRRFLLCVCFRGGIDLPPR